jgi:predicted porin
VYGRLNLGLESLQNDDVRVTRMSNYRSVLGFRGSEDLGGGLKAIFQLEGTLSPDTGAGEPFRRDTRIGLDGRWGTLFAGHWVTAYNGATSGLDPWYPTTAGYMSILATARLLGRQRQRHLVLRPAPGQQRCITGRRCGAACRCASRMA